MVQQLNKSHVVFKPAVGVAAGNGADQAIHTWPGAEIRHRQHAQNPVDAFRMAESPAVLIQPAVTLAHQPGFQVEVKFLGHQLIKLVVHFRSGRAGRGDGGRSQIKARDVKSTGQQHLHVPRALDALAGKCQRPWRKPNPPARFVYRLLRDNHGRIFPAVIEGDQLAEDKLFIVFLDPLQAIAGGAEQG